jgi:hypothetical protein
MLQKRLDAIKQGFQDQADATVLAVMEAATEALIRAGLAAKARGVGDLAPSFALANTSGETVRLEELRSRGPVVLTVFRGHW